MSMKTRSHHHVHEAEAKHSHAKTNAPAELGVSDEERFHLIQVRAYAIWEHAGRPQGDDNRVRFWCDAERECTSSLARME